MTKLLKISIITATCNCANTILDCLDSIQNQTYKNIEHIVIDGGSTDGTVDLIKTNCYGVNYFNSEPDNGIYDALNKGLKVATGDIVGFLHADDVYASASILEDVAKVFVDKTVTAVYGNLRYVTRDLSGKSIREWRSSKFSHFQLRLGWMPPHPTLFVRRGWYSRINGFNSTYKISADYLSILQMFSFPEFKSVYIDQLFINMRVGGKSNKSFKNICLKSIEDFKALRQTKVGGIFTLLAKNLRKLPQFFI